MADVPRTDRALAIAEAQRAYLDRVVETTGKTLTQIAREGQLNPSTLTRFRNNTGHAGVLSPLTLATVAQVTGLEPPASGAALPSLGRIARPLGMGEQDAEPYEASSADDPIARAIGSIAGDMANIVPWELRSRCLEYEGYRPGDVLLMDLNGRAQPGDVVCAQLYNWQNPRETETVFRIFEAPYLVPAGPVERHRRPIPVDGENVVIKAVMAGMIRRPRAAS